MTTRAFVFLFVLGMLLSASPASAQIWSNVGIRGGGTAALLRGDDVGFTDDATDRRLGVAFGVYKAFPVGHGFAIQPELMYTQKGGDLSLDDVSFDGGAMSSLNLDFEVDYIELPVTIRYAVPTNGRLVPMVYAGPYIGLTTQRNIQFELDDATLSVDADDVFKRLDYGAVFGGDLGLRVRQQMVLLGVRYDLGIADIGKDGAAIDEETTFVPDVRTDEWSILIGFQF